MAPTVFFDLGDTLASVVQAGDPPRLVGLNVYPYVRRVLDELLASGISLGIISHIGPMTPENVGDVTRALEAAELARYFPDSLRVYGKKDSSAIFVNAATRAGHATEPEQCVFTGEDSSERTVAQGAGMRVCPHPLLVMSLLQGQTLSYVRITVPEQTGRIDWRSGLLTAGVIPLYVTGTDGREVYAIAGVSVSAQLDDLGFLVDRLGGEGEPLRTELFLFRDDRQKNSAFLAPVGNSAQVFAGPSARRVLASTREGLIVAIPGHTPIDAYHFDGAQHGHTLKLMPDVSLLAPSPTIAPGTTALVSAPVSLRAAELDAVSAIDAVSIRRFVERFAAPTGSRHILHGGNKQAVDGLLIELQAAGGRRFNVHRHQFTHQGRTLQNIEAELLGTASDEIVIVGAHLDSTAKSDGPSYDASIDNAPGADDDGSGVAAVLAIATAIGRAALTHPPKRTIRCVLFNAEEDGLVGSKAYARSAAFAGASIVGVFQIDMIGFRPSGNPPSAFEVHVGYPASSSVVERSLRLASIITSLVPALSPNLKTPEIYSDDDPAAGRSDHASFQERGYAACVCSENAFAGPTPGSAAEINPSYHRSSDTLVDADYAADIARLVAGAVLVAASE